MRSGVSTDSQASTATFAAVTGSFDANYGVTNLAGLDEPSKVARVTPAAGAAAFTAVLAADRSVQFAAMVNHSLPAGATVRIRFYSDAGMTAVVSDQGPTTIPAPVAGYAQTFPVVLVAALTVRAVRVDLASAGGAAVDIGGLEVGGWWEWPWISEGAEAGFADGGDDIELAGGGSVGAQTFRPRTYAGQVSFLDLAVSSTTAIDFQKRQALSKPFVFLEDAEDATTWPRSCFLARNTDLPPLVGQLYEKDQFQFRFREHAR